MLTRAKFIHLKSGKRKTRELTIQPCNNEGEEGRKKKRALWRYKPAHAEAHAWPGAGDSCSTSAYSWTESGWQGKVPQAVAWKDPTPTGPFDKNIPAELLTAPGTLERPKVWPRAPAGAPRPSFPSSRRLQPPSRPASEKSGQHRRAGPPLTSAPAPEVCRFSVHVWLKTRRRLAGAWGPRARGPSVRAGSGGCGDASPQSGARAALWRAARAPAQVGVMSPEEPALTAPRWGKKQYFWEGGGKHGLINWSTEPCS